MGTLHDSGSFFRPGRGKGFGPERGEVLLDFLFAMEGWNVGVEVVAVVVEAEFLEVGKVREGGRDLPIEVITIKVEMGESGKCSELSRKRAFEAIIV